MDEKLCNMKQNVAKREKELMGMMIYVDFQSWIYDNE